MRADAKKTSPTNVCMETAQPAIRAAEPVGELEVRQLERLSRPALAGVQRGFQMARAPFSSAMHKYRKA